MAAADPVELRPVVQPWRLRLPRTLAGFRSHDAAAIPIVLPDDMPGTTDRRHFLKYCRFIGDACVAVIYPLGAVPLRYEVVISRGGQAEAFLSVPCPRGGNNAELRRALSIADRVSEELAGALAADPEAEAWLRRQLAGLGGGAS